MTGKNSDAEKNFKVGNKISSNNIKISSKSILSYQNGSALNVENRKEMADEGIAGNGCSEGIVMPQESFLEDQNLKNECLDLLRKKLISDLSLTVFSPDLENKLEKMEPIEISKERQSVIQKLLLQINQLSDAEKLLLYLKLASSTSSPFDPLRQPLNPLGNRQEIQQTIVWIKTHLEEDSEISIPKQDVYDQYLKYCENVSMKPLSTADFGKVMKQVYPGVRPRRLGTRGNSRYCYSGMRNTCKLPTPLLPQSSVESSTSNGSSSDGPFSAVESTNLKKLDRPKRKLKSGTCGIEKCTALNRSYSELKNASDINVKNVKRSKVEGTMTEVENNKKPEISHENDEPLKEKVHLSKIKCEKNSDNSFNTLEIECELDNDLEIYLKNVEKVVEDSPPRSSLMCGSPSGFKKEENKTEFQKTLFSSSDSSQALISNQNNRSSSEENLFSLISSKKTEKPDSFNIYVKDKISDLDGLKRSVSDQGKPSKGRVRRSSSFSKPTKNLRKCYVPIQPKPIDIKSFNVCFEKPVGINQFSSDQKLESERLPLCEESDSQEPEEEIVRYFKHLDENQINGENLVDQAVKNIDSITVQNISLPHIVSKSSDCYQENDDVLNYANQQSLRSQSCFEVQSQLFSLCDNRESVQVPRSQSSVELPMSIETMTIDPTHPEAVGTEFGVVGKGKKISHLRILLEKSISTSNKISYSSSRENSNILCDNNSVISTAQNAELVSQVLPIESYCAKPAERDSLKLNGLKILSSGPSYMPQSPNNRTKYFSFTPISPGPQSPLKTPSTPSASPFVSPRNTPLPRLKQTSNADFFLSPSERKSSSSRLDNGKSEFASESDFNFSKTRLGNHKVERSKKPTYLQACRPRSFSSTNFCRSKVRRNSSKFIGDNHAISASSNRVQAVAQTNFSVNSQFYIHKNFLSSECLSNEVRKFLESNSMMAEDRSATIRSQSVPLNRMISESTWMPTEVSTAYSSYVNSENAKPALTSVSGKFLDWSSNSETNSPKNITANVSPFLTNGEMTSMEPTSLNNEVFSEDPTIVQLDQYFAGDFRSGDEENFRKNESFHQESAFSNKLDLNSSGAFESPFTNESDPVIPDNIKSYLPDFEGLGNKNLGSGEIELNDRKLIKTPPCEEKNDNLKDPVITSFKPLITNEISYSPGSPVLSFFGNKMNEDNQQLIEFFDFED